LPKCEIFSDILPSKSRAYNGWREARERRGGAEYDYCRRNFLSINTMRMICDMKAQLVELLCDIDFCWAPHGKTTRRFFKEEPAGGPNFNVNSGNMRIVKAVLTAGLYPNVAKVTPAPPPPPGKPGERKQEPKPPKLETRRDGEVKIHPCSVNFECKSFESPWLVYHEKVKTSAIYLRDSTMVTIY